MSKFHDEFFRRGSPAHDKLMIKCLSKEGIDRIIETVDFSSIINEKFNNRDQTVLICTHGEGRTAHKETSTQRPTTGMTDLREDPLEPYKTTGKRRACSLEKSCKNVKTCKWLLSGVDTDTASVIQKYSAVPASSEYETEVIVKNGQFILGYADAVISTKYDITSDAYIDPDWTWKDFSRFSETGRIIIEVKPKVDSIGDVIRQIKTYHDALVHKYSRDSTAPAMCLVTYDQLDKGALEYLANEHILVVVFEET